MGKESRRSDVNIGWGVDKLINQKRAVETNMFRNAENCVVEYCNSSVSLILSMIHFHIYTNLHEA